MSGAPTTGDKYTSYRKTFFAIREKQGRLFTFLKNREITYTYMGRAWERGHLENPWGSYS